jgi:hypothetical protein
MVGDVIRDDDDDSEEKMKKKLRTKGSEKVNKTKANAPVKEKAPRKRVKSTKIVIEDDDDDKGQENPGGSNPALNEKAAEFNVVMNESSSDLYQSDYSMGVPSDSGKSNIS